MRIEIVAAIMAAPFTMFADVVLGTHETAMYGRGSRIRRWLFFYVMYTGEENTCFPPSLQPVSTVEGTLFGTNNCQPHFKATLVVNGSISEGRWSIDVVAILA